MNTHKLISGYSYSHIGFFVKAVARLVYSLQSMDTEEITQRTFHKHVIKRYQILDGVVFHIEILGSHL